MNRSCRVAISSSPALMRTSTEMTWPAVVSTTPARVAAMLSSVALRSAGSATVDPVVQVDQVEQTLDGADAGEDRGPGETDQSVGDGPLLRVGDRVATAGTVRAGDADVVGDHVGRPGVWSTAVSPESVCDLRQRAARRERQQGTHGVGGGLRGDHRQPTARRPRRGRSAAGGRPGKEAPRARRLSSPSGTSAKDVPSRRCSGFGTTRPAHTTSGESNAASISVAPSPTAVRLAATIWRVSWARGPRRSRPRTGRAGRRPARPPR